MWFTYVSPYELLHVLVVSNIPYAGVIVLVFGITNNATADEEKGIPQEQVTSLELR